jgi:hypothetical protein
VAKLTVARVSASSSLRWIGAYRWVPRHCSNKRQACRSFIPYCSRARSTAQRRRSGLRSFPSPRLLTPSSSATAQPATASAACSPSKFLYPLRLFQLKHTILLVPAVVSLHRDLRLVASLRCGLAVGHPHFDLPQQRYDLAWLIS